MGSKVAVTTILLPAAALALWSMPARALTPTCKGQPATVVGSADADVLDGTAGPDVIVGLGGDDVIRGWGGDDLVCGGDGDDEIRGGADRDEIYGGRGADEIYGGRGGDEIYGGRGADEIYGGRGSDVLSGGPSADQITAGPGSDVAYGGGGSDTVRGGAGIDKLHGDRGRDVVAGGPSSDQVFGGPGRDELYGGRGHDLLRGAGGSDFLHGGLGTDYCRGGGGADGVAGCEQTKNAGTCAEIQVEIDAAAASGSDAVHLPLGNFECTAPVVIADDGLRLEGSGLTDTRLVLADHANAPVLVIGDPAPVPVRAVADVEVHNLAIDGNKARQDQECMGGPCGATFPLRNNGITVRNAYDVAVTQVDITGARSGGLVTELGAHHVTVNGLTSTSAFWDGLAVYGTDSSFTNLRLVDNEAAGISIDTGGDRNEYRDVTIVNPGTVGVFLRDADGNRFVNLDIVDSAEHGVFLAQREDGGTETAPLDTAFSNVTITGAGGDGFRLNDAAIAGTRLDGATIADFGGRCIFEAEPGQLQLSDVTCVKSLPACADALFVEPVDGADIPSPFDAEVLLTAAGGGLCEPAGPDPDLILITPLDERFKWDLYCNGTRRCARTGVLAIWGGALEAWQLAVNLNGVDVTTITVYRG